MRRPRGKRQTNQGFLIGLILVAGLVFAVGFTWVTQWIEAPWSFAALAPTLTGTWNGDSLTLTPSRNPFVADGRYQAVRTISTDDPDDGLLPTQLRKGDAAAFQAACRRLAA